MDKLMVTMSGYRKTKKPLKDKSEEEFVLELCNIFSACCIEAAGKQQFLEFEGIELMLIMLKNRQFFRIGCIKVRPRIPLHILAVPDGHLLQVFGHVIPGTSACNNRVPANSRSLRGVKGYARAACHIWYFYGQKQDCWSETEYR